MKQPFFILSKSHLSWTCMIKSVLMVHGSLLPDLSAVSYTLQWRHNEPDGVSNHQPRDCLLSRLIRRRSKKTSKLCGLCVGNSPVTGEFPALMARNAGYVSSWWRHHDLVECNNAFWILQFWILQMSTAWYDSNLFDREIWLYSFLTTFEYTSLLDYVINMNRIYCKCIHSLWHSNAIWWHRSGSTQAQVMTCCLTAPGHYLIQCWIITACVLWLSPVDNFTRSDELNPQHMCSEIRPPYLTGTLSLTWMNFNSSMNK